jgi:hypothetical protein
MVERQSPVLHRRRVKFVNLARETRQAIALLQDCQASVESRIHAG